MTKAKNDEEYHKTLRWWRILSSIALCNIFMWFYSIAILRRNNDTTTPHPHVDPNAHSHQYYHLVLSGVYVFVCAYRSFLPRIDLERYCLFDTKYSSIVLGRAAATVAEVSFSAQVALFMYNLGGKYHHPNIQCFALFIVPCITVAQCFCWCGVLTLNRKFFGCLLILSFLVKHHDIIIYIHRFIHSFIFIHPIILSFFQINSDFYHAVEESIWAIMSAILACSLLSIGIDQYAYTHNNNNLPFISAILVGSMASTLFFLYMITVDVPMYLRRWRDGMEQKKKHAKKKQSKSSSSTTTTTSLEQQNMLNMGRSMWKDALERRVVTQSWNVWKEESVWLTCYFSSGVWLSLMLVHIP